MNYDENELSAVREQPNYIAQLARCRAAARLAKMGGISQPPKIVDGELVEFYGSERAGNNDKYGKWLTNCVGAAILVDGIKHSSTEHCYQKCKFQIQPDAQIANWCKQHGISVGDQIKQNINTINYMSTLSPVAVAKYGQTNKNIPIRSDWDAVRNEVMWNALVAKFTQNAEFATKLKETGNRVLVERAPTDAYWAINNSGLGENTLGVMLMIIRDTILE